MAQRQLQQVKLPFPWKLLQLLEDVEKESLSDVVSWLPDGKAFKVHKPKEFQSRVMKAYFNQTKFKSFTRQLYIYGFSKVADGHDAGAFFHPDFVRSNKESCLSLKRNQVGDRRLKKEKKQLLVSNQESAAAGASAEVGCAAGGSGTSSVPSLITVYHDGQPSTETVTSNLPDQFSQKGRQTLDRLVNTALAASDGDIPENDGTARIKPLVPSSSVSPIQMEGLVWDNLLLSFQQQQKQPPSPLGHHQATSGLQNFDKFDLTDLEPRPIEEMVNDAVRVCCI